MPEGTRAPRSNYRVVARTSEVDETLFARTQPPNRTGGRDGAVNGPIPGAAKLATLKSQRSKAATTRAETDSVLITRADIERMRGASSVLTPEEVSTLKKERVRESRRPWAGQDGPGSCGEAAGPRPGGREVAPAA